MGAIKTILRVIKWIDAVEIVIQLFQYGVNIAQAAAQNPPAPTVEIVGRPVWTPNDCFISEEPELVVTVQTNIQMPGDGLVTVTLLQEGTPIASTQFTPKTMALATRDITIQVEAIDESVNGNTTNFSVAVSGTVSRPKVGFRAAAGLVWAWVRGGAAGALTTAMTQKIITPMVSPNGPVVVPILVRRPASFVLDKDQMFQRHPADIRPTLTCANLARKAMNGKDLFVETMVDGKYVGRTQILPTVAGAQPVTVATGQRTHSGPDHPSDVELLPDVELIVLTQEVQLQNGSWNDSTPLLMTSHCTCTSGLEEGGH